MFNCNIRPQIVSEQTMDWEPMGQTMPFLKWAGGKRWLIPHKEFQLPTYSGSYVEPFLGGGALFFNLNPRKAILSDINVRLIETYQAIREDWELVWEALKRHSKKHSKEYYYIERARRRLVPHERAAQFLYLNRSCWNGLYRENLKGEFNVPIGTKEKILFEYDDFEKISKALKGNVIHCCDFEETIMKAKEGDFMFVDPPYTTAHNYNGFVKYNQNMFSWDDQLRLKHAITLAVNRGVKVLLTNAYHENIIDLYRGKGRIVKVPRVSKISGTNLGRKPTTEALIYFNY